MEGYITLTEKTSSAWELVVKLPLKWLRQFGAMTGPMVCGDALREMWGDVVYEDSVKQPWRSVTSTFPSLSVAESTAAEVIEELRLAKESLKPRGYVRYVLDLDHDNVPIKDLSREGIPTNNEF